MDADKAVKLRDIARELGLSISTVSRAMSGNGRVSPDTKSRVMRAVKQSHYTPNDLARSLRMRDTKNIGIIVTDITNTFFSSVIKGAQAVSRSRGYSMLLSDSDENPQFENEALQLMLEKQISGLILATVGGSAEKLAHYRRLHVPIVFIDNMPDSNDSFDSVSTDNYHAAYSLTQSLLRRCGPDIGIITGPLNQSSGWQRWKGFETAMTDVQLPVNRQWIREGDFKLAGGEKQMRAILEQKQLPRGMIFCNNYMAYGAISAIHQAGYQIPHDIAVASFDTEDITSLIRPSITTINQPAEQIGRHAADILISRIVGESDLDSIHLVMDPILVPGGSW